MISFINKRGRWTISLLAIAMSATFAVEPGKNATIKNSDDSIRKTNTPLRVYTTTRLTTEKPVIDGNLNDASWKTGTWAGDYIQWEQNQESRAKNQELKTENHYILSSAFPAGRISTVFIAESLLSNSSRKTELTGPQPSSSNPCVLYISHPRGPSRNWSMVSPKC